MGLVYVCNVAPQDHIEHAIQSAKVASPVEAGNIHVRAAAKHTMIEMHVGLDLLAKRLTIGQYDAPRTRTGSLRSSWGRERSSSITRSHSSCLTFANSTAAHGGC